VTTGDAAASKVDRAIIMKRSFIIIAAALLLGAYSTVLLFLPEPDAGAAALPSYIVHQRP
jgi:predicted acyltransferase